MDQTQFAAEQSTGGSIVGAIIYLALVGLMIASMWKIFTKAGEPGWASIVPIYNYIVMLKIAGKPAWWFVLMFIPFVNFVIGILAIAGLAKAFGKGAGFTIGLVLLGFIFFPMLAFGDAEYVGAGGGAMQPQYRKAA